MENKVTVVVTSISSPNKVMKNLADGCFRHGYNFIVIGDRPSPPDFHLEHCAYYGIEEQLALGLETARKCPERHYARKNVGYLVAMRSGTEIIVDTDDDNFPRDGFWRDRSINQTVRVLRRDGWVNIYRYFTRNNENVWPRGFPLDSLHAGEPEFESLPRSAPECPIQQGLADENPDVDAIHRLVNAESFPLFFRSDRRMALGEGSWCPFNSQNTSWWQQAFPLLYLPAYCSFRMTDIWRSFVAQRIAWENDWCVLFHEPTVWQERNEHDLMKDFADEIPGYLLNKSICNELGKLQLKAGPQNVSDSLLRCYEKLVSMEAVGREEIALVQAWVDDIGNMRKRIG